MQKVEIIELNKIADIVHTIFQESAIAYEDYSNFDQPLKKYEDEISLIDTIYSAVENNEHSANFAIYYSSANGYFFEEKKELNPEKCKGATFRYAASGWGLIHLQIDFDDKPQIEVRVAVNTLKRAEAWSDTYPELKDPYLWDWKYVEKQARRIIRVLKKCA